MIFAGLDPGVSGALAFLDRQGHPLLLELMPTVTVVLSTRNRSGKHKERRQIDGRALAQLLRALGPGSSFVTVEAVNAFKDQGLASTFAFGRSFGQVLGVIECLGLAHELVYPQRWQSRMFDGLAKGQPKKRAALAVHRLFPGLDPKVARHDGICDALLLAEYGRRQWQGQHMGELEPDLSARRPQPDVRPAEPRELCPPEAPRWL